MDKLPEEIINLIIRFASPRLSDDLKDYIEVYGMVQNKMYEKDYPRLKYTFKCGNGEFRRVWTNAHIRDLKHSKYHMSYNVRGPFDYSDYYSKKELMDILKEYYGGGKIPLVSKLKNKRQIVQRLMSL